MFLLTDPNQSSSSSSSFFFLLHLLPKLLVKIKMKKRVGVGCVTECVEVSREREKRNGMFWNESGQIQEA